MPEFGTDLLGLSPYGVPLLLLTFWLTQVIKEALQLEGRYVQPASVGVGLLLSAVAFLLPEVARQVLLVGLGLAAAANLLVRYAKKDT